MKANELMVGDWVWLAYRVGTFISKVNLENLKDIQDEKISAKPIPLTEEILEQNGLYDCAEFYDGWNFELTDNKMKVVSVGSIWFVHELQHALKLCGLNELANNFKIE